MSPTVWHTSTGDVEGRLDAEFYLPKHLATVQRVRRVGAKKLADLELNGSYGVLPKSEEYGTGPVPLVRGGDLSGMPLTSVPDDAPRVPATYLANKRGRLGPEEVLLLVKGATIDAPQSVGIVPASWSTPAVVNGSVYKFRVRAPADPYFVAAFFGTPFGLSQKTRAIANTGINYNDQDSIRAFWVPQPAPDIQRAIGNKMRKAEQLLEAAHQALDQAEQRLGNLTIAFPRTSQRTSSVRAADIEFARLDAEFYQPHFLAADAWMKAHRTDSLESLMVSGSYGVLPDSADYGKGTLGFLRATNVEHLYVDETKALRVPASYAQPKGIAREGDVLLEVKGMISGGAVCPAEVDGFLVNGSIFRIRPKPTVDPHFLAAVLVGPLGVVQKQRAASNSVISYVSIDFVRSLRIPRFGEEAEREIGDLVRAFVDGRREALRLVESAKGAVEALIDGTLNEATVLAESDAIEQWLAENPSPSQRA